MDDATLDAIQRQSEADYYHFSQELANMRTTLVTMIEQAQESVIIGDLNNARAKLNLLKYYVQEEM